MTIDDLEAFILVCQLKSISKAARQVNLSQSELSKRLRKMAEELNSQLINTTNKRHLEITDDGKQFLQSAQTIVKSYEAALQALAENRTAEKATLKIGTVPIVGQYRIASIIAEYNNQHPHVQISLLENEGEVILNQLKSGQVDAVILRDVQAQAVSDLYYQKVGLITDELKVVMVANHPLATQSNVSPIDLRHGQVMTLPKGSGVYELMMNWFKQGELEPEIYFQSTHIETLIGMLQHSASVTFLFQKSVGPFMTDKLKMKSLTPPVYSDLQFVYPRRHGNQLLLSVLHRLTEAFRNHPSS